MEISYLDKFKDPQFRLEVYEYLINQVYHRINYLNNNRSIDWGSITQPGYTGFMCFNLTFKYANEPGFVEACGTSLGHLTELHKLLPELHRPYNYSADISAWFGDDLDSNIARLNCLNNALELLKQKINQK